MTSRQAHHHSRSPFIAAAVTAFLALVGSLGLATTASAAAGSPYCGISWGSLEKASQGTDVATMTNVRAGRHACYDRLVLDYQGRNDGYSVRYVPAITGLGLPQPVDLRGGALLEIVVAQPYGPDTQSGYHPADRDELVTSPDGAPFGKWPGSNCGRATASWASAYGTPAVPGVRPGRARIRFPARHRRGPPVVKHPKTAIEPEHRALRRHPCVHLGAGVQHHLEHALREREDASACLTSAQALSGAAGCGKNPSREQGRGAAPYPRLGAARSSVRLGWLTIRAAPSGKPSGPGVPQ